MQRNIFKLKYLKIHFKLNLSEAGVCFFKNQTPDIMQFQLIAANEMYTYYINRQSDAVQREEASRLEKLEEVFKIIITRGPWTLALCLTLAVGVTNGNFLQTYFIVMGAYSNF